MDGVALNAKQAVSASGGRMLKVWDLRAGQELGTLTGHRHCINAVAVTPDGRLAVSVSCD